MPTLISILNGSDRKTFEAPPVFTEDERATYFNLGFYAQNPEKFHKQGLKVA